MIVCADDFGLADDINEAIINLIRSKKISAVSCIITAPSCTGEAIEMLRPFESEIDIGLHFALTEAPAISPITEIASIATTDPPLPYPVLLRRSLLGRIVIKEAETEIKAQYERFAQRFGRYPDFLDSHLHIHQLNGIRDGLISFLDSLPDSEMPYIRNSFVPLVKNIKQHVSFFKTLFISHPAGKLRNELKKRGIFTNHGFAGIYDYRYSHKYKNFLVRFFDHMESPNGIIMVHPGLGDKWRLMEYNTLLNMPSSLSDVCQRFNRNTLC